MSVSLSTFFGGADEVGIDLTASIDPNIKLLLQFLDGVVADGSQFNHTITDNGTFDNTGIENAIRYGISSRRTTDLGETLTIADSPDWHLASGDFTIHFWVYGDTDPSSCRSFRQQAGSNSYIEMLCNFGSTSVSTFRVVVSAAAVVQLDSSSGAIDQDSIFHVAITRSGNTFRLFINGALEDSATSSVNIPDFTGALTLFDYVSGSSSVDFYHDEFIWLKGAATWTASFTPPLFRTLTTTALPQFDQDVRLLINANDIADPNIIHENSLYKYPMDPFSITNSSAALRFGSGGLLNGGSGQLSMLDGGPFVDVFDFLSQDFTIECWVQWKVNTKRHYLFQSEDNSSNLFEVTFDGTNTNIRNRESGSNTIDLDFNYTALVIDTWYHFAVCRIGSIFRLFINGVQAGGDQADSSPIKVYGDLVDGANNPANELFEYISGGSSSNDIWFDDYRITIGKTQYTVGFTPPIAELTALIGSGVISPLTVGSPRLQVFQPTSAVERTLPDARILKLGGPHFTLLNNQGASVAIKDNTGATIATLENQRGMKASLLNNETQAGKWQTIKSAANSFVSE